MKDAYSFHLTPESLEETYDVMHQTYARILERMTLDFRPVQADSGAIGGDVTREFQVLAESGEDKIAFSTASDYAANIEMAEAVAPSKSAEAHGDLTKVHTPDSKTIEAVAEFLKVETITTVKTLIVVGNKEEAPLVALVIRGDHQLNTVKAEKVEGVASPCSLPKRKIFKRRSAAESGPLGQLILVSLSWQIEVPPRWLTSSVVLTKTIITSRERTGTEMQTHQSSQTCVTFVKATLALTAKASLLSNAASKWATSSSWETPTQKP